MTEHRFTVVFSAGMFLSIFGLLIHNWSFHRSGPVLTPVQYLQRLKHSSNIQMDCKHLEPPFEMYEECNIRSK